MSGIISDLICYMSLLLSRDWPSFAGCLYLVFHSLLADTYMKNSKHAPHNKKYTILYNVIKVCSNTFILFIFFGIVRLANAKFPPPPPPPKKWGKSKTFAIKG